MRFVLVGSRPSKWSAQKLAVHGKPQTKKAGLHFVLLFCQDGEDGGEQACERESIRYGVETTLKRCFTSGGPTAVDWASSFPWSA